VNYVEELHTIIFFLQRKKDAVMSAFISFPSDLPTDFC